MAVLPLALGCGGGDDVAPAQPKPPPAEPVPPPPVAAVDSVADAAAESAVDPVLLAEGDARAGAEVYAQNCASCHGETGGGDGPVSIALDPRPARHNDGSYMNGLDDAYLARVIRDGGPAVGKSPLMAGFGASLSDADVANLIAFIRSLADPPYEAPSD